MGRRPQEEVFCQLILDELYDIKEKKGINFNNLFKKIKKKRGKFSFDTLSKYLTKMENDGRIIRIIDVNSNKKIKPTLLYKNSEIIRLRNEKININKILMDKNTKFHRFPKNQLEDSDFFPKFNELILKFLEGRMNLNVDYFKNFEIINKDVILENFNLFLVENPEIKGRLNSLNDIVLLLYLNLLELMMNSGISNVSEINYNLLFHIDYSELLASVILRIAKKIQKERRPLRDLFLKKGEEKKITKLTEENILQLLLNQLEGDFKEHIRDYVQKMRFEEFSEKYKKSLKIY
ncbi:MAG: hypothetical protein HWN65_20890 [Candidatus Helarchaeota archaeon]|nr:hypothetical protein [Candidatus Helarchaeota archaeon]